MLFVSCLVILSYISNTSLIVNALRNISFSVSKLNTLLKNGQCAKIYPFFCNLCEGVINTCTSECANKTGMSSK